MNQSNNLSQMHHMGGSQITGGTIADGISADPHIDRIEVVIFGGAGDLAINKLMPALFGLSRMEKWKQVNYRIVGVDLEDITEEDYKQTVKEKCDQWKVDPGRDSAWSLFAKHLHYICGDFTKESLYSDLKERRDSEESGKTIRIFYLAIPPHLVESVSQLIMQQGVGDDISRLVIEKPFGTCHNDAQKLNMAIKKFWNESQIFRIDHYLGKEPVQNLLALRFANSFLEPIWNNHYIDHVQISLLEEGTVGDRGETYDKIGAFRDMIQNHALQLLCLVAMDQPRTLKADDIREEKVAVIKALKPIHVTSDRNCPVVRGQYDGYCGGPKTGIRTTTETFAALKVYIENARWAGVPFYLRTGKALEQRYSEIVVEFKAMPFSVFAAEKYGERLSKEPNRLVFRLQPNEGVSFEILNKVPHIDDLGLDEVALNLNFQQTFGDSVPDAYERLLMDVIIKNDQRLFVRDDEVEQAWLWTDKIIEEWQKMDRLPNTHASTLQHYRQATRGPIGAELLIHSDGRLWHAPPSLGPTCVLTEKSFTKAATASQILAFEIAGQLCSAITTKGQAGLILPGGRSPIPLFELLADMDLPWNKVTITVTDEQLGHTDYRRSNGGQIQELLMGPGKKASKANFIPLNGTVDSAAPGKSPDIDDIRRRLEKFPWPADVVVLGMGPDGHIASLFPGDDTTQNCTSYCAHVHSPEPPNRRISLTPRWLLAATNIYLLVFGERKLSLYNDVKEGIKRGLPIGLVLNQKVSPVTVFLADEWDYENLSLENPHDP